MASLAEDMAVATLGDKEGNDEPTSSNPSEAAPVAKSAPAASALDTPGAPDTPETPTTTAGQEASAAGTDTDAPSATPGGGGGDDGGHNTTKSTPTAAAPGEAAAKAKAKKTKSKKSALGAPKRSNNVVVKVGMVGDAQIGKTSLMVKYIEGKFDEDYIQTLGVNFMEKSITIKNTEITFSIWDLGGQREFISMLPLVCNDAVATLFMFDLSNKASLTSVKEWYRQVRGMNRNSFAFLVGTKYDLFVELPQKEQAAITKQARKFAKAMKAPLIFSSASHSININKIFKIILSRVFNLKCTIPCISTVGDPILEH